MLDLQGEPGRGNLLGVQMGETAGHPDGTVPDPGGNLLPQLGGTAVGRKISARRIPNKQWIHIKVRVLVRLYLADGDHPLFTVRAHPQRSEAKQVRNKGNRTPSLCTT